ncbi:TetR/AcrR family transcriptional regulator [Xanthomonas axonopodis pv. poinsettiicola]|uniref:TetR/AcrR family transcriptional regulator n=1 Tax=Xanthomonas TaxID=338 RepID=UPI001E5E929C|nr:TetR/AcrR family transcriptional regulator [Xanthomonas codiaei]MCC8535808.1 TetR/AcrR family transcriptional regulator [Xanthomonas codiaei]
MANTDPAPPTHRTTKGAQRIHDLLVVASERFLDLGFDAVSVDDILAVVGGSRRNVYAHFGGKEGLFKAAMLHVAAEMAKPLDALVIEGRNPAEALPVLGHTLVRTALSPRTLAVHRILTNEGKRFPDIAQAMLNSSYLKIQAKVAAWIATQQGDAPGQFTTGLSAYVLAEQFMSMTASHVKLLAIVGLINPPLHDSEIDVIVGNAVCTLLQGAAVGAQTLEERSG